MREEVHSTSSLNFIDNKVFLSGISNVSPHWQILDKHFKEVVVLNSLLELLEIVSIQGSFAEKTPVDRVAKGDIVRRGFTAIPDNTFSKTLAMTNGCLTPFAANNIKSYVFRLSGLIFFFLRGMVLTEGKRVVAVGFRGIVERSVKKRRERERETVNK
jgi:hypothetical protein